MTAIRTAPLSVTHYDARPAYNEALGLLLDFNRLYAERILWRTAVAGNHSNVVLVPGTNRRIYARLGASDAEADVVEAKVDVFTPIAGDTLLLRRVRPFGVGEWIVLAWLAGEPPCV